MSTRPGPVLTGVTLRARTCSSRTPVHTPGNGGGGCPAAPVGSGAVADDTDTRTPSPTSTSTPIPTAEPLELPGAGDWLAWVGQRCEGELAEAVRQVEQVKTGATGADEVLAAWNRAETAIANAEAVALWAEVHPEAVVRDRADELSQQVQKYVTELGQDRDLFAVFDAVDAGPDSGLDAGARRVLDHTLRDFRRAGVDRDDATRDRLARAQRARGEAVAGLRSQHPRRRPLDQDRSRAAGRTARRLPGGAPRRRRRPGRDHHRLSRPGPVHDLRGRRGRPSRAGPRLQQRRLAGQRPGPPGPAGGASRDGRPAGLRLVARLRRRGQDDRHRSGDQRLHRADQRRGDGAGGGGGRGAARAQARRRPLGRGRHDLRLALLRRARPARAVRRRRAGRAHLLRLRAGPPGAARRDRPAVRPGVDPGPARRGRHLARRGRELRRRAAGPADRSHPPRPPPA